VAQNYATKACIKILEKIGQSLFCIWSYPKENQRKKEEEKKHETNFKTVS